MDGTEVIAPPPAAAETIPIPQPMIPQQQMPSSPVRAFTPPDTMNGGMQGFVPSPSDIENHAAAVHHSRLAGALNAVGDILGGNKTLRMVQNPDGSVDVKQVDSTSGEKWGRVAQAALSGAATGFAVGQGPGGAARAAAASLQQGMAAPQAQKDKTLAEAEKYNNQNQQRQLFNANMAMMNQKLVKGAYDMQQAKVEAGEHEEDRAQTIMKTMDTEGATKALHVGAADDPDKMMEDIASGYNSTPELQQAHHDGRTLIFRTTDPKTGLTNGADIYIVPEDKMDKPTSADYTRKRLVLDPEHPEAKPKWSELGKFDKGALKVRDQLSMMQSDDDYNNTIMAQWQTRDLAQQKNKREEEMAPLERQTERAKAASGFASAQESRAGAALKDEQKRLLPEQIEAKNKATQATMNFIDNKYVSGARETEKSWQMADRTFKEYEALRKQGKEFPTGAESMLLLSRHLQTTFGQVKGSRVTKDMIAEHLGARGVSDNLQKAVQAAFNGDQLSPNQWKAFHKLIGESRQLAWQGVVDASDSRGIDPKVWLPGDLGGSPSTVVIPPHPGGTPQPGGAPPAGNTGQAARAIPPIPQGHTPKVNYVQGSDNQFYWIEPENLAAAQATDPKLKVIPR